METFRDKVTNPTGVMANNCKINPGIISSESLESVQIVVYAYDSNLVCTATNNEDLVLLIEATLKKDHGIVVNSKKTEVIKMALGEIVVKIDDYYLRTLVRSSMSWASSLISTFLGKIKFNCAFLYETCAE